MKPITLLAAPLAFASACSGPVIKSVESPIATTSGSGVIYALPKAQVQISIYRRPGTSDALAFATNRLVDAITALKEAEAAGDSAKITEAQATFDAAQGIVDDLRKETWTEGASITALPVAADVKSRYRLTLNHDYFRDDHATVSIDNGLLSSGSAKSTDETPNIIATIAETIAVFATGAPGGAPKISDNKFYSMLKPGAVPTCGAYEFSTIIDPTDQLDIARLKNDWNQQSRKSAFQLEVDGQRIDDTRIVPPPPVSLVSPIQGKGAPDAPAEKPEGLHYRAPKTIRIDLKPLNENELALVSTNTGCHFSSLPPAQSVDFSLPDSNTNFVIEENSRPLVTAMVESGFKDGMITNYAIDSPSEALAFASLPLTVVRGMLSAVTDIFQFRVNQDSQKTALVKGKTEQATAMVDAQTQKYKNETDQINVKAANGSH